MKRLPIFAILIGIAIVLTIGLILDDENKPLPTVPYADAASNVPLFTPTLNSHDPASNANIYVDESIDYPEACRTWHLWGHVGGLNAYNGLPCGTGEPTALISIRPTQAPQRDRDNDNPPKPTTPPTEVTPDPTQEATPELECPSHCAEPTKIRGEHVPPPAPDPNATPKPPSDETPCPTEENGGGK